MRHPADFKRRGDLHKTGTKSFIRKRDLEEVEFSTTSKKTRHTGRRSSNSDLSHPGKVPPSISRTRSRPSFRRSLFLRRTSYILIASLPFPSIFRQLCFDIGKDGRWSATPESIGKLRVTRWTGILRRIWWYATLSILSKIFLADKYRDVNKD